jgi:amino acid transporter
MSDSPETASMPDTAPALKRELRLWDVVFFNVAAVASVRWIAAAAHSGPGSISLWILAVLIFFIPSALVVASLSRRFPEEGGLYIWTKRAFGDFHGFLCAWLYFISNLLFVPSFTLAAVAMSAYIWSADPGHIAQDRHYTLPITLLLLWGAFLSHLFGLKIGKWTGNIGGLATYTSAAVLAIAAAWLLLRGSPSATRFNIFPSPTWESLNTWSQIAFAFVGLELGAILGGEIVDPRRNVPRAAWISAAACAVFYIVGTSSILVLLPQAQVSQVTGLVQAGQSAGALLGIPAFPRLFALLIVVGIFGSLGSWIAGNTRLPFVIGLDQYLPGVFAKLHPRWRTPYVSILSQAVAATLLLLATQAGETVTAAYQILVDMTVITTFLPYVYIFAVGWKFGQPLAAGLGMTISLAAILLSLVPPPEVVSWPLFETKVILGCVLLAWLGRVVFIRNRARA